MPGKRDDPPPFLTIAPRSLSPVLLTCEHAARRLPGAVPRFLGPRQVVASHWGWDIGSWELTRELAASLPAGAIGGRWSRLLIDLNRKVDDPTLILPRAGGVTLPWNTDLDAEEIEQRILRYHATYHAEIDRLILRRLIRGVRPLVFAVHTFTPVLDGHERRFEVGILFRDHPTMARRLGKNLKQTGLAVRYNQPYSGIAGLMYAAERHGAHHGLPCLELEVNQALFARRSAAGRLARVLAPALRDLVEHCRY